MSCPSPSRRLIQTSGISTGSCSTSSACWRQSLSPSPRAMRFGPRSSCGAGHGSRCRPPRFPTTTGFWPVSLWQRSPNGSAFAWGRCEVSSSAQTVVCTTACWRRKRLRLRRRSAATGRSGSAMQSVSDVGETNSETQRMRKMKRILKRVSSLRDRDRETLPHFVRKRHPPVPPLDKAEAHGCRKAGVRPSNCRLGVERILA